MNHGNYLHDKKAAKKPHENQEQGSIHILTFCCGHRPMEMQIELYTAETCLSLNVRVLIRAKRSSISSLHQIPEKMQHLPCDLSNSCHGNQKQTKCDTMYLAIAVLWFVFVSGEKHKREKHCDWKCSLPWRQTSRWRRGWGFCGELWSHTSSSSRAAGRLWRKGRRYRTCPCRVGQHPGLPRPTAATHHRTIIVGADGWLCLHVNLKDSQLIRKIFVYKMAKEFFFKVMV